MPLEVKIDHQMYVVPSVVDGAVVRAQSEYRRDHRNEATVIHDHAYSVHDQVYPCTNRCMILIPEFETISYLDFKQGAIPPRKEDNEDDS